MCRIRPQADNTDIYILDTESYSVLSKQKKKKAFSP